MSQQQKDGAKDLDILRREYRNMEVNRKAFNEESNAILRKQQQTLEKLRTENENLKVDVTSLQARTTMKPLNSFEQNQLDKVAIEIDKFKQSIEAEKKHLSFTEKRISDLQGNIWSLRKEMGGANAATDNQKNVEKQIRILENKLDQALIKFNTSLAKNNRLRQEIDNLRGERVAFEGVYKKLEKGLQEKKRNMSQVIELSNLAYEDRDKSRLEIAAIEQANKKEQDHFDRQIEELENKLQREIKAAEQRRKSERPVALGADEESKAAAEKLAKANALLKEREAHARQRKDRIQNFEEAFRKIAAATGISDVDMLVKVFLANDEHNFSLFTYAIEQSNEIDRIVEQVQLLHQEEATLRRNGEHNFNDYDRSLEDLALRIKRAETQTKKFDDRSSDCQTILENLKDGIKMLLSRLGYNVDNTGEILVDEENMLRFLGFIEEQTNIILGNYHKLKKQNCSDGQNPFDATPEISPHFSSDCMSLLSANKILEDQKWTNILGSGPKLPMVEKDQLTLNVNPPRLTDYSSDEFSIDDDEGTGTSATRPLRIEEVKARTLNKINQPRRLKPKMHIDKNRRRITRRRSLIAVDAVSTFTRRGSIFGLDKDT